MKYIASAIITALVFSFGLWWLSSSGPTFTASETDMVKDLHYRFIAIPPQGQLWGVTPEQNIELKKLQTKTEKDVTTVAVEIVATANVSQTTEPETKVQSAISPDNHNLERTAHNSVTVELRGIAKLRYEWINNKWYLAEVTSVNLKASQKDK